MDFRERIEEAGVLRFQLPRAAGVLQGWIEPTAAARRQPRERVMRRGGLRVVAGDLLVKRVYTVEQLVRFLLPPVLFQLGDEGDGQIDLAGQRGLGAADFRKGFLDLAGRQQTMRSLAV